VPTESERLSLSRLGRNHQAAIRTMIDAFRRRGWRDSGAALAIVQALEDADGTLPVRIAARHTPPDFLARNELRRRDVEDVLRELSSKKRI
jgi:DNA-directed RNA polymerase specialized sigma24 family protein